MKKTNIVPPSNETESIATALRRVGHSLASLVTFARRTEAADEGEISALNDFSDRLTTILGSHPCQTLKARFEQLPEECREGLLSYYERAMADLRLLERVLKMVS